MGGTFPPKMFQTPGAIPAAQTGANPTTLQPSPPAGMSPLQAYDPSAAFRFPTPTPQQPVLGKVPAPRAPTWGGRSPNPGPRRFNSIM